MHARPRFSLPFVIAFLSVALALHAAPPLPLADPASPVGFSPQRLTRIDEFLRQAIANGRYAGATWLVARDGKIVTHGSAGWSDLAARTPMTEEKVFAVASMTKLITTVTILSLIEEGRLYLDDPIADYFPELTNMKVLVGGTAAAPQLVPAIRPITIRHLLTHTSGFSYGLFDTGPLMDIYTKANLWESPSSAEFVTRASKLPLKFQPGEAWNYGINMDLLGALIEKITGQPLEVALQQRIFRPLGMNHTGFTPPAPADAAKFYSRGDDGKLTDISDKAPKLTGSFRSAGGGLYSTLHDYARFAQMLLNRGELDGAHIIGRKSVEMMTSNQVDYLNPRPHDRWLPPGFGFGVRVRRSAAAEADTLGSPGMYGWEGLATTYVSIDTKENLFLLLLLQHAPYDDGFVFEKFTNTVYQALDQ